MANTTGLDFLRFVSGLKEKRAARRRQRTLFSLQAKGQQQQIQRQQQQIQQNILVTLQRKNAQYEELKAGAAGPAELRAIIEHQGMYLNDKLADKDYAPHRNLIRAFQQGTAVGEFGMRMAQWKIQNKPPAPSDTGSPDQDVITDYFNKHLYKKRMAHSVYGRTIDMPFGKSSGDLVGLWQEEGEEFSVYNWEQLLTVEESTVDGKSVKKTIPLPPGWSRTNIIANHGWMSGLSAVSDVNGQKVRYDEMYNVFTRKAEIKTTNLGGRRGVEKSARSVPSEIQKFNVAFTMGSDAKEGLSPQYDALKLFLEEELNNISMTSDPKKVKVIEQKIDSWLRDSFWTDWNFRFSGRAKVGDPWWGGGGGYYQGPGGGIKVFYGVPTAFPSKPVGSKPGIPWTMYVDRDNNIVYNTLGNPIGSIEEAARRTVLKHNSGN